MTKTTRLVGLCLIALTAGGSGCAGGSRVTIPTWQQRVEKFVRENGNDPAVLRDVTLPGPDARPGFAAIGSPDPNQSADVYAVLLGQRIIDNRPWIFYLAGEVQKQRVEHVRLAALSVNKSNLTWRLGPSDAKALEQYRAFGEHQWRERFPGRATAPPEYLSFPRADDAYDLNVARNHVSVTHRQSGARWELTLDGKHAGK